MEAARGHKHMGLTLCSKYDSMITVFCLLCFLYQAAAQKKEEAPARPASPFAGLFGGGSQTIQVWRPEPAHWAWHLFPSVA
jgi:hypothetical protein